MHVILEVIYYSVSAVHNSVWNAKKRKQTFREHGTPGEGSVLRARSLAWLSDVCCVPSLCRRTVPHSGECICSEGCHSNLCKEQCKIRGQRFDPKASYKNWALCNNKTKERKARVRRSLQKLNSYSKFKGSNLGCDDPMNCKGMSEN